MTTISSIMVRMEEKPDGDKNYDIFRQDLETLEVAEEHVPKKVVGVSPSKKSRPTRKRRVVFGIFLTILFTILVLGITFFVRSRPKQPTTITINTQSLDNGTLNKISLSAEGETKQQLTISPDTLFLNSVSINKDLTVKGQTYLQSSLTIDKELTVGGNVGVGGNLSVTGQISAGNLNVGSVTISSLRLSGDLEFGGHLIPTGAVPTIKPDVAASGGSATIVGNDTAGTITITTGGGIGVIGEMAIVTFRSPYSGTPKVQLTPVSASASKLDYFVTRSSGFFTIEATSIPATGSSYVFDYLVTQ